MPVAGGAPQRVTPHLVWSGWWSIAQGGIYLADLPEFTSMVLEGPFRVLRLDPSSGQMREVAAVKGAINRPTPDFTTSSDGKTLCYSVVEVFTSQIRMLDAM